MGRRLTRVVLLGAVSLPMAVLSAQPVIIKGVVHLRGESAQRLSGVEIMLDAGTVVARTDSSGAYRLGAVPPGEHFVRFRRIGYESALVKVYANGGRETTANVGMEQTSDVLATITIRGQRVTYPARHAAAYARASRGPGRFFLREEIDSLNPLDVASLLQHIPGVKVNDRRIDFGRCYQDQHIQVWVDGSRLTNYSGSGEFDVDALRAVKEVVPTSIQIMEVYSSISQIPGDYLADACAAIVIWRK